MKKYILFTIAIASINMFSLAQSIVLTPNENPVDGEIVDADTELITEIAVQNTSENTIDIMVSREVVSGLQGTQNLFCWTACYGPSTSVSTSPITFAPGELDENRFAVHYLPNENLGSVTIKYCAYVENNPLDSACVNVTFNATTISVDDFTANGFSEFYPNPTSKSANIQYSLSSDLAAEIILTDMLGNKVVSKEIIERNGILDFDLSSVNPGLYFANIFIGNELNSVKRLVVTK